MPFSRHKSMREGHFVTREENALLGFWEVGRQCFAFLGFWVGTHLNFNPSTLSKVSSIMLELEGTKKPGCGIVFGSRNKGVGRVPSNGGLKRGFGCDVMLLVGECEWFG